MPVIYLMKISSSKIGDLDLSVKVTEADKGKEVSSRYLNTDNMYCFHNNTSDPYDETQVQG